LLAPCSSEVSLKNAASWAEKPARAKERRFVGRKCGPDHQKKRNLPKKGTFCNCRRDQEKN
jgi:hypothetical protein